MISPLQARPRRAGRKKASGTVRAGSQGEFLALQRMAFGLITQPLGRGDRTRERTADGRLTREVAATLIKRNDRLSSLERLEIYNRQYWFRLIDVMYEDFPGVLAVVGQRRFNRLVREYLVGHGSRSWTLRNLGSEMPGFVAGARELVGKRYALACDVARFEWAQVIAFDGLSKSPLSIDDLLGKDAGKLRMGLQPYLVLLEMDYPVDDFDLAVKRAAKEEKGGRPKLPRAGKVYVAVHRVENDLYYKRLERGGYVLLCGVRDGKTVAKACEGAVKSDAGAGEKIGEWFRQWAGMGWFCRREGKRD